MGIFGLFGNSENLYFPGCFSSAFLRNKAENYRKILKKLRIEFDMHKDGKEVLCCGGILEECGYEKDLRKIARENLDYFRKKGVKRIITSCPLCLATFKKYRDLLPDWDIDCEHVLSVILKKINEEKNPARNYFSEPVAYYDSCILARESGMTDAPREILQVLGYKITELSKNREETLCCGSCGNLPAANPELADKIALNFIKMLRREKIKKITTANSRDYVHILDNLKKLNISPEEIQVIEISDLICGALNLEVN